MSFLNPWAKPQVPTLTEEDKAKLRELKRQAYMQEAEKLIIEKGKQEARRDINPQGAGY